MSIDPLAAGVADLAALVDAELASLAADAQALRGLLVENAVVTARVLPSNGLTDLLEIAGRRVAASLPPTVRPGDVLQVQVTGFDGDRILLQVIGTGANAAVEAGPPAAAQPVPEPLVSSPAPPAPSAPTAVPTGPFAAGETLQATVVTGAGGVPQLQIGRTAVVATLPAGLQPGDVVTVRVVAAGTNAVSLEIPALSQRVTGQIVTLPLPPPAARTSGADIGLAATRANVAPPESRSAPPPASVLPRPVIVPGQPTSIESRLAAARAAIARVLGSPPTPPESPPPAAAVPNRFVIAPHIAPRTAATPPATHASPTAATAAAPRASALAAYAQPVALLRALRLPVTPSNVASAALALERPDALPSALATLERALPRASTDPNVATLRTLLSFVGRIDPRSPALATQVAAYVEHVVDGSEPKLATQLAASRAAQPNNSRSAVAEPPTFPAAVAAERAATLSVDLKQTMLAVAANPDTPSSVAPALASALTALTSVQLTAAQTLAANPAGLDFTIPLTTEHGHANARISVKRDAPGGRGAVDGENFRIAFVLDTAHYGTIAIDLVTVGRDVTVDVRAESAPAMRAFRDALGTLTARLSSLRYRVASAEASVGVTSTVAIDAPPSRPVDPDAVVDRSA